MRFCSREVGCYPFLERVRGDKPAREALSCSARIGSMRESCSERAVERALALRLGEDRFEGEPFLSPFEDDFRLRALSNAASLVERRMLRKDLSLAAKGRSLGLKTLSSTLLGLDTKSRCETKLVRPLVISTFSIESDGRRPRIM